MHSYSVQFKLLTLIFGVLVLSEYSIEACGGKYRHLQTKSINKRDTDSIITTTLKSHIRHTRYFSNHHQVSNKNSRRSSLIRKRCRYSESEAKEHFNRDLSNNNENFQQHNYVKHHQIRDGQSPYYLNPLTNQETNNIDQSETERLFVNIGERINLTCNINTREIDWHFKDTNLTTTILSYGLQLQVRQPVILETKPEYNNYAYNTENYQFQDTGFDKRSEQILKYELSSDFQSRHQLRLFIEGSKDEGSYQCVDSQSETPVKKTIHVILSKFIRQFILV